MKSGCLLVWLLPQARLTTPTLPELGVCEATPGGFNFRLQPPLRTALGVGAPPTYGQTALGVTEMESFAFTGCFGIPSGSEPDFDDLEPADCFLACASVREEKVATETFTKNELAVNVTVKSVPVYAGVSQSSCYCLGSKSSLVVSSVSSCSSTCSFTDPPAYQIYTGSTRLCGGPSALSLYESIAGVSALSPPQLDHIRQLMWQVGVLGNSSHVLHATAYSNGYPMFMYDYILPTSAKVVNLQVDYLSSYLVAKRMTGADLYIYKVDTRSKADVKVYLNTTLLPSWGECVSNRVSLDAGGAIDPLNKIYYRFADNVLYGLQYTTNTLCLRLLFAETILAVTANADSGDLLIQLLRDSVTDKGTYFVNLGKMHSDSDTGVCSFTPTDVFAAAAGANYQAVMSCTGAALLDDNDRLDALSLVPASAATALKNKFFMMNNVNTDPLKNRVCFAWANDRSNARWQLGCASADRGLEASYQLRSAPVSMATFLTDPGVPKQAPRPFIVSSKWELSGMTIRVSFNQGTLRGGTLMDTDGDFLPDLIDTSTQCPVTGEIVPDPSACPCAWVLDDDTLTRYASRLVSCAFRSSSLLEMKFLYPVDAIASETFGLKLVVRKDSVFSYLSGLYSQAAISESLVATPTCDPATMYPLIAGSPLPARGFAVQQDLCSGSVLDYCLSGNTGGVRLFAWSIKDYGGVGFMYQTKLDTLIAAANGDRGDNDGQGEYRRGACRVEIPSDAIEPGKKVRINVQLTGRWCGNLVANMDIAVNKQAVPSPVVTIVAPTTVVRSDQIILQANVTATACTALTAADGASGSSLKYEWSLTPYSNFATGAKGDPAVLVPLFTPRADASELTFRADALSPGASYLVGVKVGYAASWPTGATTTFLDLTVPRASISCSCSVATQSIASLAVFDCRKSYDRDFPGLPPMGFDWSMECSRADDLPCIARLQSTATAKFTGIPSCSYAVQASVVEIGGLSYVQPTFTTNRDRLSSYLCQGTTSADYGLIFMNAESTWGEADYKAVMTAEAGASGRTCQTTLGFSRTSPSAPVPVQPNLQVQLAGPNTQPLIRNIYGSAVCVNCMLPVLPGFANRVESGCSWAVSIETLAADWIPYEFGVVRRSDEVSGEPDASPTRAVNFHAPSNTLPPDAQFRFKVCCTPAGTQSGVTASCRYAEFATAPAAPSITAVTVAPASGEANVCRRVSWKAASTAVLTCKGLARVDAGYGAQDMPFTNGGVTEDNLEVCYLPVAASVEVCVSCCDNYDSCTTACSSVTATVSSAATAWDAISNEIAVAGAGSPIAGYLAGVQASWGPAPSSDSASEASAKERTSAFVAEIATAFFASVNTQDSTSMGPSEVSRASAMVTTLTTVLGENVEAVSSTAVSNVLSLGAAGAASLRNMVQAKKSASSSSEPVKTEVLEAIDASLRSFGTALTLNTKLNEGGRRRRLTDLESSVEATEQTALAQIRAEEAAAQAAREARQVEVDKIVAKIAHVQDEEERAVLLENLMSQLSEEEADRVDKLYAQSLLANGFSELLADISGTLSSILTSSDEARWFNLASGALIVGRTATVSDPTASLSLDPLGSGSESEVGYAIAEYSLDPWGHLPSSPPGAFLLQASTLYTSEGERLSFAAVDRAHVFFADKLTYASGGCYWLDPSGSSSLGSWRSDGFVNSDAGCLGNALRAEAGSVAVFVDPQEPTRVFVSTDYYQDSKSVWVLFSAVTVSVLVVAASSLLVAFYAAIAQDKKERKLPPQVRVPLGDGVSGPRSLSDPIHYQSNNVIVRTILSFLKILKRDHLLLAPFFPDPALKLKRANRLAALVCAMAGCFVGPAILYGAAPASDFAAELHFLEAALISALLVFPLGKLVLLLFVAKPNQPLYPQAAFNASNAVSSLKRRSSSTGTADPAEPPPPAPPGLPPVLGSTLRVPTRAYQTDRPSETVGNLPVLGAPTLPATLPAAIPGAEASSQANSQASAALPPAVVDVLEVDSKELLERVRRQYVNELLVKSRQSGGADERSAVRMAAEERATRTSHSPVSVLAQALAYATCAVFVACATAVTAVYVRNFNQSLSTTWLEASAVAVALVLGPFELLKAVVILLVELRKLFIRKRLLEEKLIDRKTLDKLSRPPTVIKPPKIRPPYFENIPRPPPTPPPVLRGGLSFLDLPPTPRVDLLNT